MDYKFVYDSIVLKAKNRTEELEYYENHHILPKSLGGSNDKTNLVKLTAREHFICHWLLVKMYAVGTCERQKMLFAFWRMKSSPDNNGKRYINSKAYEKLRIEFSKSVGDMTKHTQMGELNSQFGKHWYTNYETGECRSLFEKPNDKWIEGRNLFIGESSKLKSLSVSNLKKKQTELETKEMWNKFHNGNYNKLEDFSKILGISKIALHNRFVKYIPIYTKHKQVKRKHFVSDKNLIDVFE